jgi:glucose/arabinose dehydrogenase
MPSNERAKTIFPAAVLILAMAVAATTHGAAAAAECQNQDVGISLSPGFCATVFADNLGHVRHLAVSSDNVVYANSWSGRYYHNDTPPAGGFLLAIKDTTGSGKAAVIQRFGPDKSTGAAGGTGVALYNGALYAELNDKIVRYVRTTGEIAPSSKAETVLSGMPLTGDHPMHPFVIDATGNLFVDLGSATNACQAANRMPLSPGHDPCIELETRAGICATMPTRLIRPFRRPSGTRPAYAMARVSRSIRPVGSMSRNMAAISCRRTGPSSIRSSRASSFRPRRSSS